MLVLHLTAHLGGGVGKALSGLIIQAKRSSPEVQHLVVCLEKPEKRQFIDRIQDHGNQVILCPQIDAFETLIRNADVVQLEWWNHPATIKHLCLLTGIPLRLLTWCHISGLSTPIIPPQLLAWSHIFLFTSSCSFEAQEVINLTPEVKKRLDVVPSNGGFSELPVLSRQAGKSLAVGYLGSLNFAKLHPHYIEYLAAVKIPGFKVKIIGEAHNQSILEKQCKNRGKPGMLEFRGYRENIASELASINILAYLLNPGHYGTNENALLEAMAMEVVPIVLENPAERQIVTDHQTGLVVRSPTEFAAAIQWLADNPDERQRIGKQAAQSVREKFAIEKIESALNTHYRNLSAMKKRKIGFTNIFGSNPAEWFLSCQQNKDIFVKDDAIHQYIDKPFIHGIFEKNKGSVFHFSRYFPNDKVLKLWAMKLRITSKCLKTSHGFSKDQSF